MQYTSMPIQMLVAVRMTVANDGWHQADEHQNDVLFSGMRALSK